MGLDIRFPIGMMFTFIGLILLATGFVTGGDAALYQRSLGININIVWGGVLFVFGALMWGFAAFARKK